MYNRWFKKYLPDYKSIQHSSQLRWLTKYIHHSYLWHLSCESVARGVAVGLFTGIIPLLSFQTFMAIGVAILIRANLPIALLVSWISNPFTILPIAYFTYYVGHWILGGNPNTTLHFSWQMNHLKEAWSQFGIPFFVGLPIVAIGTALVGYFCVKLIWHVSDKIKKP
jgi:uncharacterized protein (DUF2062 family)